MYNISVFSALKYIDIIDFILSQFWSKHKIRLSYCRLLRNFEQRFKEIQNRFLQLSNEIIQLTEINKNQFAFYSCESDNCNNNNNNNNRKEDIDRRLIQLDALSEKAQVIILMLFYHIAVSYLFKYLDNDQSCYSIGKRWPCFDYGTTETTVNVL